MSCDWVWLCWQVKLLKDVLEEWKKEVDKKPPEMSVDQAYDTLGLKTGVGGYVCMCMCNIFKLVWTSITKSVGV